MNKIVGIRTLSTFSSVENWNRTHRLAGKCYVIGGIVILVLSAVCSSFSPEIVILAVLVPILLISMFSPVVYSYVFYRKQLKSNEISAEDISKKLKPDSKKAILISIIITITTVILCSVLLFSGEINFEFNDTELEIVADLYSDISINYDDIDSVELKSNTDRGSRVFGYGSPKLLMGSFRNDEYGDYIRYSYTKCDNEITISANGSIFIISGKDSNETTDIYNKLIEKCN